MPNLNVCDVVWINDIPYPATSAMSDEEFAAMLEVTVDQLPGV